MICKLCAFAGKRVEATKTYRDPSIGKVYVCDSCAKGVMYEVKDLEKPKEEEKSNEWNLLQRYY